MTLFMSHCFSILFCTYISLVTSSPTTPQQNNIFYKRQTKKEGSFYELNKLLDRTTIFFPPQEFSITPEDLPSYNSLQTKDFKCSKFAVTNLAYEIDKNSDPTESEVVSILFKVKGLNARCRFKWDLDPSISFLSQSGDGNLNVANGSLRVKIFLRSRNFNSRPPTSSQIRDCEMDLDVLDVDISGSLPIDILDALGKIVLNAFSTTIYNQICGQIEEAGSFCVTENVQKVADYFEPYFNDIQLSDVDPLSLQSTILSEDSSVLVDFTDTNNKISVWMNSIVDQLNSSMSSQREDPYDLTRQDLGVNILLREKIINGDDGKFIFDPKTPIFITKVQTIIDGGKFSCSILPIDPIQAYTNIDVSLKSIKIKGLDSFKLFQPLSVLGKHTLKTHVEMEQLNVEVEIMMKLQEVEMPKDPENLLGISFPERFENITIKTGMSDIKTIVSTMAGLDLLSTSKFKISSFLYKECAMRYLDIGIAQLDFSVGQYEPTTVSGIFNSELDDLITDFTQLGAETLYKSVIENAFPNFLGTDLRLEMNEKIDLELEKFSSSSCKEYDSTSSSGESYVNFHSMLTGSSNNENQVGAYGDIIPLLLKFFNDNLAVTDSQTGLPVLNKFLITSLSTGRVFGCETSLLSDLVRINITNVHIENIDSIGTPLKLLQTDAESPYEVRNNLIIGAAESYPLVLTISLGIAYDMFDCDKNVYNEIDIRVELEDLEISSLLHAKIDEVSFMNFPLEDAENPFCWMGLLSYKDQDSLSQIMRQSSDILRDTFSIKDVTMNVSKASLSLDCVICDSTGMKEISNIFDILTESGTIDVIMKHAFPFLEEQTLSDEIHFFITSFLQNSKKYCPHNQNYDPSFIQPNIKDFSMDCAKLAEIPFLGSKDSIEFLALVIVVGSQVAAVILNVESDRTAQSGGGGSLSIQQLISSNTSSYLDFMNITIDEINALHAMNCQLNKSVLDEKSPNKNGVDYFINAFVRALFLDSERVLLVELKDIVEPFILQDVEFSVESIEIYGLDSFENFKLAYPLGPQTLHNEVLMKDFKMDINIEINFSPEKKETLTLSVALEDFSGSLDLFLAINEEALLSLQVGSFLNATQILPCLMTAVDSVEITHLSGSFGKMKEFGISGFVSKEIEDTVKSSFNGIFSVYGTRVSNAISSTLDKKVRRLVNKSISDFIISYDGKCHDEEPMFDSNRLFIDFRDLLLTPNAAAELGASGETPYGRLLSTIWMYLESTLSTPGDDGLPILNEKIADITNLQSNVSGALIYPETFVNFSYMIEHLGPGGYDNTYFKIKASEGKVENLDSLGSFDVLEPTEDPYILSNKMVFGYQNPLRMAFRMFFLMDTDAKTTINDFVFGAELQNVSASLSLMAKIDTKRLMNFPLRDATNLQCWIALIPPPLMDEFGVGPSDINERTVRVSLEDFSISKASFDVNCISCTSPEMETLNNTLLTKDSIALLTKTFITLSDFITSDNVNAFLEFKLDRELIKARALCPHIDDDEQIMPTSSTYQEMKSPETGDNSQAASTVFFVSILSAAVLVVGSYYLLRLKLKSKHREFLNNLSDDQIKLLYKEKMEEEKLLLGVNQCTESMINSKLVPKVVRFGIPAVIFLNMGLFLNSHLYVASKVNMPVVLGGEYSLIESTYGFSLVQAVEDMWTGGMKPLAMVIIVCSLAWPYIKQSISLFAWCAPPARLSISKRGNTFHILDNLGKWSMLDIYTLVMFVSVFKIDVEAPDLAFIPPDSFKAGLFLEGLWGLYANLLAQILSQLSSHVIIFYHRKVKHEGFKKVNKTQNLNPYTSDSSISSDESSHSSSSSTKRTLYEEEYEALCNHSFKITIPGSKDTYMKVPKIVNYFILGWSAIMLFLLVVGSFVNSFRFEYSGFLGIAIAIGNGTAEIFYSVFDLLDLLIKQGQFIGTTGSVVGTTFLVFLIATCSIVVPFCLTIALCCMWFMPLGGKRRHQMKVLIEILMAWQYVEVYVLGVFVAMTQVGSVVDNIVSIYCSEYSETFRQVAYFGIVSERDARCFFLLANLEAGCWMYISFSVMLLLLTMFVSSALTQQKLDFNDNKLSSSRQSDEMKTTNEEATEKLLEISIKFTDIFEPIMIKAEAS